MTTRTASTPTAEALLTIAQDATLQALVGGQVFGVPPDSAVQPYVWIEVPYEDDSLRGLGTGGLATLTVRVHTFTRSEEMLAGNAINERVVQVFKDAALPSTTGFAQAGLIVYRSTTAVRALIDGETVNEVVAEFTIWMDQQ